MHLSGWYLLISISIFQHQNTDKKIWPLQIWVILWQFPLLSSVISDRLYFQFKRQSRIPIPIQLGFQCQSCGIPADGRAAYYPIPPSWKIPRLSSQLSRTATGLGVAGQVFAAERLQWWCLWEEMRGCQFPLSPTDLPQDIPESLSEAGKCI